MKTAKSKIKLTPILKKIVGKVNLPKDFDENKVLRKYFEEKHFTN